jgi:hypothetical protein
LFRVILGNNVHHLYLPIWPCILSSL